VNAELLIENYKLVNYKSFFRKSYAIVCFGWALDRKSLFPENQRFSSRAKCH